MRELMEEEWQAVGGGIAALDPGEFIAAGVAYVGGVGLSLLHGYVAGAGVIGTTAASLVFACW